MNHPPGLLSPTVPDVQAGRPKTEISLTRVGVTGVEKVIRVESGADHPEGQLFFAQLQCFVDLNPQQAGAHMSRFEEIVNEAIDEVVLSRTLKAEQLAAAIAQQVRDRQGGLRAEVSLTARYPETVPTPVTDNHTQEIYTLYGTAVASEHGTRTLTGVEAQGMTACPCAQQMVAASARERLAGLGYTPEQVEEIIDAVPVATHNQRGIGTLHLGRPETGPGADTEIDARQLLRIVESSMSSEIFELMKRTDEQAVVEKAHANPRFVEDCVREMVRQVAEQFPELAEGGFLVARQENLETIHRHNVVADRTGELSEILRELETGEHSPRHTSMRDWLEAPAA